MRSLMVIFLLFCYACVTTGKENVIFSSKNFINILTWDSAEPRVPGEKVRYSVFYYSETEDKNLFQEKAECQNITELFCDLTAETPAVYDVRYRAQVLADGMFHGQTIAFKPIAETVLQAPILSISTTMTSLHVNVTLPLGPNNESITDIFRRIKQGPSKAITVYSLHITQPLWAAQEIENTTGHFIVNLKNDQAKYCGYVVYKPAFEWGRRSSENASFCVTLSGDPWMAVPWSLMSVAVLSAVVLMASCCARRYVKDVKNIMLPRPLVPFPSRTQLSTVLHYPDEVKNISKVVISTISEHTGYAKIQVKPMVSSPLDGGYGHKNTVVVPWKDDSSLHTLDVWNPVVHYQDDSSQSSDIYGAVAMQFEDNEDFQQRQTDQVDRNNTLLMCQGEGLGESGPLLTTLKTIPLSSLDIYENNEAEPLLLDTQRDSDGQLILQYKVQPTFSGITESLTSPERKSLLPYLIVLDKRPSFVSVHSLDSSGCSDSGTDENTVPTPTHDYSNRHYLPTHQQDCSHFKPGFHSSLSSDSGTCESPYRQNWMPTISHGPSTQTYNNETLNYTWTWSGVKEENEEG